MTDDRYPGAGTARWLGYLGLIPFLAGGALALVSPEAPQGSLGPERGACAAGGGSPRSMSISRSRLRP